MVDEDEALSQHSERHSTEPQHIDINRPWKWLHSTHAEKMSGGSRNASIRVQ